MHRRAGDDGLGLGFVAVSAVCFGSLGVFGKLAGREGMPLPTLLGLRFALAAAVLWAVVVAQGGPWRSPRRTSAGMLVLGGLYVGQSACYFSSLRTVPAAVTSILLYVYPGLVTLLARVVFGERLTRRRLAALLLAAAGVVLVVDPGPVGHLDAAGVALGLGSAVVYSAYIVVGDAVLGGVPAAQATAVICTVAGASYLVAGAVSGGLTAPSMRGWGIVAGVAAIPTVVAASLFLAGLSRVGATRAAIISTLEPATTALLAAAILGEGLSALQVAGGAVVIAAAILVARSAGRRAAAVEGVAAVRE